MPFAPIDEAVAAIARGEFVVVVDDADRENEGDLIIAAEKITPEGIAFMVRHTSGVICLPVVGARLDELRIPLMVADNTESQRTAFTVSVDAKIGTKVPEQVTYVELYSSNRTDAEIIAQQKKDMANKLAAEKERQRQFQKLEKQLGM